MEFKRRNLALLLLSARESVMANFRPTLKAFGLTDQQWRILRALNSAGEMEAGQIADTCKILSPSLTGILSRSRSRIVSHKRVHRGIYGPFRHIGAPSAAAPAARRITQEQ